MSVTLYRYHPSAANVCCPVCGDYISPEGKPAACDLRARAGSLQVVHTVCTLKTCPCCELEMAISPTGGGSKVAFRCLVCRSFGPDITPRGWCLMCTL
ncbi:MAG: hypothetical protein ACYCW6_03020 [Candidatus Xenobia bacterium]